MATRTTTVRILDACPWKLCLSERVTRGGAKQGRKIGAERERERERESKRERERQRNR